MSRTKKQEENNMFGAFSGAVEEREKKQQQIEDTIKGTVQSSGKRVTMQIAMSLEDKIALKMYAARQNTPVSEIIHQWIIDNCQE